MKLPEAMEQARQAHYGQVDKGGKPYIEHPLRVAYSVRQWGVDAMVVALLHDVLEDTDYELTDLSAKQKEALDALTRQDGEVYADYVQRVSKNALATVVKVADLRDNMSSERMASLPDKEARGLWERYAKALELLTRRPQPVLRVLGGVGWPE
jgi:(p)ppGpp synthase/HD superfamily hydrolase